MFPDHRPRRMRTTAAMRRLTAETVLRPEHLVLPMFVSDAIAEPREITSMPGVYQHTDVTLLRAAHRAVEAGVGGLMVFGVPGHRDPTGSAGDDHDGVLNRALRALRREFGDDTVIMADTCLDEFTDHGHCGVLSVDANGRERIDNDQTVQRYVDIALAQAEHGAHVVSPSGMMDGQVQAIRSGLDAAGYRHTSILAYAVKYASALYGPFREAVDSQLTGDRRTYQMDPANRREARRELDLDLAEGADMVMVKPASLYLDVLRETADHATVPVAAYQVSGEYAMIHAAGDRGWLDAEAMMDESLLAIRRAGADIVLTYAATEVAERLGS